MSLVLNELQPDFRTRELSLIAVAINNFGEGDHPLADFHTVLHFKVPYVMRCLTALMRHVGHEAPDFKTGLAAMDKINNCLAERRKEKRNAY